MDALRMDVTVNEALVDVLPALRPLLGRRTEIIALDQGPGATSVPAPRITFEEFLAKRLKRPEGVQPVTLEDMQRAIIQGASDGDI